MNFLKYRFNRLRSRLTLDWLSVSLMDQMELLLTAAEQVRNDIVEANLRLVVSIVRGYADQRSSFDELISDGNLILLKSVDRFDYGRGFRFSTYATHSIRRDLFRRNSQRLRRSMTEIATSPDILFQGVPAKAPDTRHEDHSRSIRRIRELMKDSVTERKRFILERRFALGRGDQSITLRELGEELGISKERVRQLQVQALEQVRHAALHEQWIDEDL